jgi:hypothetical protein
LLFFFPEEAEYREGEEHEDEDEAGELKEEYGRST